MDIINVLFIAVALAMDAFSVSISAGICIPVHRTSQWVRLSSAFGFFQFLMPLIGYFLGVRIAPVIRGFDHWIALLLLSFIGAKMIHEYFGKNEDDCAVVDPTRGKRLFVLAVATSIDALAVGVSFGVMGKEIFVPSVIIGMVCAAFTAVGFHLGKNAGRFIGKKAELAGGIILIAIGVKIALEHTVFA